MQKSVPSFLQSESWQNLQKFIGKEAFMVKIEQFSILAIKNKLPLGLNYLYIPHGPEVDILSNPKLFDEFKNQIILLAKKEKSVFVKIDPCVSSTDKILSTLKLANFNRAPEMQPERTIYIKLTEELEKIQNDMEAETRYAVRTAIKRGVKVKIAKTISEKKEYFELFWNMFVHTLERRDLISYPKSYFEKLILFADEIHTDLYLAEIDNHKPISGAIFLKYKEDYVYLFAASENGYGRFNAPSLILWRAIEEAKNEKCKILDLWGISYSKKKWLGLTKFKKSFGGKVIRYIGAWEFSIRPIFYLVYKLGKKIRS